MEKIDGDERSHGDCPHDGVLERFAADANDGGGDNREHSRFQSVKNRSDRRNVTERDINVTERPENKDGWNNKERARHDAAARLVQKPADVNGELLRFGAGQEHAEIQRMKKMRFADPLFLLHQLGVHHRDLAARSAERDKAEFQPEPERFAKGRRMKMSTLRGDFGGLAHKRRRKE